MRHRQEAVGDEPNEIEAGRLTPSIDPAPQPPDPTADSSNEDFLFHLYRGSELLQDNRVHEAKEELERALHLQPRDSKGQDLIAVVYFRLGLYRRAIQVYEQLRRRNANDTALLLNLALCYLKTQQPALARRDLEHLLSLNPSHARAWGYLGLACERLGDLPAAERAFEQGGHHQMAKRLIIRRDAAPVDAGKPTQEVRDVAGLAYQELDSGELSFSLAEPTNDRPDGIAENWSPHELGQHPQRRETRKPETKDGAAIEASKGAIAPVAQAQATAHLGLNQSLNRRPTLIAPVGAPPMHDVTSASEFAAVERIPSHKPPSFALDDSAMALPPSIRRPVVAVPSPFGPARSHDAGAEPDATRTRTLGPLLGQHPATPRTVRERAELEQIVLEAEADDAAAMNRRETSPPAPMNDVPSASRAEPAPAGAMPSSMHFPDSGVVLHPSGVAMVYATAELGFAARLESIRVQQSGMKMQLLERQSKGKPNGESFGGIASPMALAQDGQLILGPRPGRRLAAYAVQGEMCFVREEVLLGFEGSLAFENGRLTTGEGEHLAIVQFRGTGTVLLEVMTEILPLNVHADRGLSVRREIILGWFGRLVPRAIAPGDAPCGQRGLVSFAGEGRVLASST